MSPYKSRAQQGLFHYLESKGKMPKKTVHEWDEATDYHDLPDHVKQHLAKGGEVGDSMWQEMGYNNAAHYAPVREPDPDSEVDQIGHHDYRNLDAGSEREFYANSRKRLHEDNDEPVNYADGGIVEDDGDEYESTPNGPLDNQVLADQLPSETPDEKAARKEKERMNAPVNSTYVPDSSKYPDRVKERPPIKENRPRLDPTTGLSYAHGGEVENYDYQAGRANEYDSAGEPGTEDEMEDKHPMEYMHKGGRKMARGGMANRSGFIKSLRRTG